MKNKILNLISIAAVAIAIGAAYFVTKGVTMNAGIKMENMDLSVNPGDNFYDYATLGWQHANPLPAEYSRYGQFDALDEKTMEQTREIIENDTGKIGTLYRLSMDTDKLNSDGTKPVAKYIAEIDAIKSKSELAKFLGNFHKTSSGFWSDGVALDEKDSTHYIYNIGQGGLGISRDYYFDKDSKSVEIRKKYKRFIKDLMANFNIPVDAEKLYNLELRMAKSFNTKEQLRDPHLNYHKMSLADVKKEFPNFDWDAYLSAREAKAAEFINVNQPRAIAEMVAILNDTDLNLIKTYLKYHFVSGRTSMLDDKTYDIAFDFYNRTIGGQKEPKPRWKRAIGRLNSSIGDEIGHLYVDKYFSPDAKKRMQELVKNLQRALGMRIENLEWMSTDTKQKALAKLNTFKAKLGYPDKWRDYSNLKIDANKSLLENMMHVSEFHDAFWLDKIGKEKDPTLWYMNAHEINAYYDPSTNEICFPAGILQPPFFDMNADDAFNYGAIGVVIGHEMTHGFDDMGRNFDKDGNLVNWWTDADAKSFEERANVMVEHFNKIPINNEVYANGKFTLGENLADYGGVTVAYTAYKNFGKTSETVNGLTPDMRFFLAFAGVWAQNQTPDSELSQTKTNEHSLGKNRVNGILPHIDAWYRAFNITSTHKLYIADKNRVKIW